MPLDVRPLNMRYLYPIQMVVESQNTKNVVSKYHWVRFCWVVSQERLEVLTAAILKFSSLQPRQTLLSISNGILSIEQKRQASLTDV